MGSFWLVRVSHENYGFSTGFLMALHVFFFRVFCRTTTLGKFFEKLRPSRLKVRPFPQNNTASLENCGCSLDNYGRPSSFPASLKDCRQHHQKCPKTGVQLLFFAFQPWALRTEKSPAFTPWH